MYSINNIWTLSIKQIFQLFLCSYFESTPNGMKSFPIEFFINFLYRQWVRVRTKAFYILYFFFYFLFVIFFRLSSSKRKEFCYYITWIHFFTGNNIDIVVVQGDTTHKKILSWASHILRIYHLFYYFKNFIYAGLFFISYNGWRVKIGEVY